MAASSSTIRIGLVAEDNSDIDVMYALTCKIIAENKFTIKKFVGHGCGKLRNKCGAWAAHLIAIGCKVVVVIHDRDGEDECDLRASLESSVAGIPKGIRLVLIPIEEIEAWLLSDGNALKSVFKMRKVPKVPSQPERVRDPKRVLRELVRKNSKTEYLNTRHNGKIAKELSLESLKRCPSFEVFPPFIRQL